MKKFHKVHIGFKISIAALLIVFTANLSVYAASRKAITSISLSIDAEIMPGTDIGSEEIDIDTKSDRYSVDDYLVLNNGSTWESDMVPEIQVTLTASDDSYFKSIPKSKIGIRGDGEVTKGSIKDSSSTMLLTIQFPSLKTAVPEVENIQLSDRGIATWDAVPNAGSYEILFYKNGKAAITPVESKTNVFNCRERLGKGKGGATYNLKVRAVNQHDETSKGKWGESNSIFVSEEDAEKFRQYPDGGAGSWKQSEDGRYWYKREDGTYPKNEWQELAGGWYFFDEAGYMKTGWIDWKGKSYYCLDSGEMLQNASTPDGMYVGSDGAKIIRDAATGTEEEDPDAVMRKEWEVLQGSNQEE